MTSSSRVDDHQLLQSEDDLYALLNVTIDANTATIKRAYRRQALIHHPDKNRNSDTAARTFQRLSRALHTLCDPAARAAYDRALRARLSARLRTRALDAKRRRLVADLQRRESQHSEAEGRRDNDGGGACREHRPAETQAEIERLRDEGTRLLVAEEARRREQRTQTAAPANASSTATQCEASAVRAKIQWSEPSRQARDEESPAMTRERLCQILGKYGDIVALVVSVRRPGTAVVEFACAQECANACLYERGTLEQPLRVARVRPST